MCTCKKGGDWDAHQMGWQGCTTESRLDARQARGCAPAEGVEGKAACPWLFAVNRCGGEWRLQGLQAHPLAAGYAMGKRGVGIWEYGSRASRTNRHSPAQQAACLPSVCVMWQVGTLLLEHFGVYGLE